MNPKGPLGEIEYFYIRKEYQQRGAPHMHCMMWVKGAPRLRKDGSNADEVMDYINRHISCSLPDSVASPVLYDLVSRFQVHRCSGSCRHRVMKKGKCVGWECRFNFPQMVSAKGVVRTVEEVQASRVTGRKRLRSYYLPRTAAEMWINDYSPALLYIWQSNIDPQFVGDSSLVVNYYINKYVSKPEMQKPSIVSEAIDRCVTTFGTLKKIGCQLLKSRQLGIFEAADKLLRLPMYRINVIVKRSPFYMPDQESRRLKTMKNIEELPDDSTDIFCRNFQHSYYPCRPVQMEQMSTYEVLRNYDYCTAPINASKEKPMLYMEELRAYYTKRIRPAVVRMYKTTRDDPRAVENHCFNLLALFKPWRNISELLVDKDGNARDKYSQIYASWVPAMYEMQQFASSRSRLQEAVAWAEEIQRKAAEAMEREVAENEDREVTEACEAVSLDLDAELIDHSHQIQCGLTQEMLNEEYQRLNTGQRKAFDFIIKDIAGSKPGEAYEPQRLFVSGVGGTGKSFLIKAVRNYMEFNFTTDLGPSVLVAAPTGVAAINVEGVTLHRLLKLPVQKSLKSCMPLWTLGVFDAKILRMLFRNVKLLIVGEASMLSNLMLLYIHLRLMDIKDCGETTELAPFANLNVLLLGDLLQLPPVNAQHVFASVSQSQIHRNMGLMGSSLNLWDLFQFVELTENTRQREDADYADILDRVRIGSPTVEDLASLRSRLLSDEEEEMESDAETRLERGVEKYLALMKIDPEILCLMPLTEHVDKFNLRIMELLKLKIVDCLAEDGVDMPGGNAGRSETSRKSGKKCVDVLKKWSNANKKKMKTADTGGLETKLTLAVGARVMLRRNLDPSKKLVNGSIGTVTSLVRKAVTNQIEAVCVAFGDGQEVTKITKVSVKYSIGTGVFAVRTQFPITLAYAITVHKCQGLSLETALVDIGSWAFADGMAYVALSRVRRLTNLHLLRLAPGCIKCDGRCVRQYNRLRRLAGCGIEIINYNANPEFKKWDKKVTISVEAQQQKEQVQMYNVISDVRKRHAATSKEIPSKKMKMPDKKVGVMKTGEYLKMSNDDGHSCFANAAL